MAESALARTQIGEHHVQVARAFGEIDLDDLKREVADAGGNSIWWGVLAARAHGLRLTAKVKLERTRATVARDLRREKTRAGDKITDDIIKTETQLDASVQQAEDAEIDAVVNEKIMDAVHRAVSEKQTTLRAMTGALAREVFADPVHPRGDLRDLMRSHRGDMTDGGKSARRPVKA